MEESNTLIIVFGGTGDLMQFKIAPSLYKILENKDLNTFKILGCGRSLYQDNTYFDFLKNNIKNNLQIEISEEYKNQFYYLQGDLNNDIFYSDLSEKIKKIENTENKKYNLVFYFSILPNLFNIVIPKLKASEIISIKSEDEIKLVFEKPFGNDRSTSKELNDLILNSFQEKQIYRVEHYLGKPIISKILNFRFQDGKYEYLFNKNCLKEVEIFLLEKKDVDNRGEFYDKIGTLKDVGQNHILQLLAISLMDKSISMQKDKELFFLTNLDFDGDNIYKKYQYNGYRNLKNVNPDSNRETAFSLKTKLNSEKYKDVKVNIFAGKAFKENKKQIILYFNHQEISKIIFEIEESQIYICIKDKLCELYEFENLDFPEYIYEYKTIFEEVIKSNKEFFLSFQEIDLMWKFIDNFSIFENTKPNFYIKGEDYNNVFN